MKRLRIWWIAGAVVALALVLAFPLRDVMQRTVILPLAYLLWTLGVFYRAMPQVIWWVLVLLVVMLLILGSLAPGERYAQRVQLKRPLQQGQVEELAQSIRKTREGVYFKWLVANRLGRLAHKMLAQREGERNRSVFAPLVGVDWQPSSHLQKYLETGLHGSFSDYPASKRAGRAATSSPLDMDVEEAVIFLESQLETRRDRYR